MTRKAFAIVLAWLILALAGCGASIEGTTPAYTAPVSTSTSLVAPSNCHIRGTGLFALPDPHCSPGATNPNVTQGNIGQTICKHGWTKTIRPPEKVTEPEKLADMKAYGITSSPRGYELDHLISLELGGAPNSYSNYWPEPGASPNPKDKLENLLKHRICEGKMSLVDAQKKISLDWVAAYREYVK